MDPPTTFNPANNTILPVPPNDPMLKVASNIASTYPLHIGYRPSFSPNMRPPRSVPAPYFPSPNGPNFQQGWRPGGNPDLPYISPHLAISPGDPGWTPPTSVGGASGPISMMIGADPSMTFTPGMSGLLGR